MAQNADEKYQPEAKKAAIFSIARKLFSALEKEMISV
jgi:hypothetical protein